MLVDGLAAASVLAGAFVSSCSLIILWMACSTVFCSGGYRNVVVVAGFFSGDEGCELPPISAPRPIARTALEFCGGKAAWDRRRSFIGVVSGVASTAASGGDVPPRPPTNCRFFCMCFWMLAGLLWTREVTEGGADCCKAETEEGSGEGR